LWATDNPVPQGGLDGGSAGPLREGKGSTFEGGHRVPLVVRWPGHIPPGRTITDPASMVDWMPTLAAMAGAALPEDLDIDGRDITALLTGQGGPPASDYRFLYFRNTNTVVGGYREDRWKLKLKVVGNEALYARYDHEDLLFDLEADPGEQKDLSTSMPEKVAEMKQGMEELLAEIDIAFGPAGE
jgi:arylsulfatase A